MTHDPVVSGVPEDTDTRILRVFSGTNRGSILRISGELTASIFHSRLDPVTGKTRRARSSPDASSMSHSIVIPRAEATTSGDHFEVLVGFDVTPAMAEFNRNGNRFRANAGTGAAQPPAQ